MEKNRLAIEAGYLGLLMQGLEEYAKQFSGIVPADVESDCTTLEVIHRENGIVVILTIM